MLKRLLTPGGFLLVLAFALTLYPGAALAQFGGVGTTGGAPVDVILIVDISGSMERNDPDAIRVSAAKLFVDLSREGDRLAVVKLGDASNTEELVELTEVAGWLDTTDPGRRRFKEPLDELAQSPGRNTFMGTSLNVAYDILDQTEGGRQQYVVMLTDGLPTGEGPNVLSEAVLRFERKRFWKIFPVALGPEADVNFLQEQVAAPSNGIAFQAATPEDLISVYTQIFALTRENNYVNTLSVAPGVLTTVATVNADQQVDDLAIVIPKRDLLPDVEVLLAPNEANIVDPAEREGIYWAEDPRYEVYVVPRDSITPEGEWRMRINNEADSEITFLARSNLSIQLQAPVPRASWNELSERFQPEGEPLYVRMRIRRELSEVEAIMAEFMEGQEAGETQLYLAPVVQLGDSRPLILRDDGMGADFTRDDGVYSGRMREGVLTGSYNLSLSLPGLKSDVLDLDKLRTLDVLPLPRVQLEAPAGNVNAGTLDVAVTFTSAPGTGSPTVTDDLLIWVREPDGRVYSTPAVPLGDRYRAQVNARQPGRYQVSTVASLSATSADGENIAYTSYDESEFTIIRPDISVRAVETELGTLPELDDVRVRVEVSSDSLAAETLGVKVEGLRDAIIRPSAIAIEPQETKTVELSIGTTSLAATGQSTFDLVFNADEAVNLTNDRVSFNYNIVQVLEVFPDRTDLGELANISELRVQLRVRSASAADEVLELTVGGLGEEVEVFPNRITAPAKEEAAYTLVIGGTPSSFTGPREFSMTLRPTSGRGVTVVPDQITFRYELAGITGGGGAAVAILLLLVVAGGGAGFLLLRRRR